MLCIILLLHTVAKDTEAVYSSFLVCKKCPASLYLIHWASVRIVGVVKEALQALVQAAHNLSRTVADRDLLGRRVDRVGSGKDRVVRILRARTRTQESASKRVASLRNKRTS